MNDIAKQCISDKLIKAMSEENLKPADVGKILNFHPAYVSMIRNQRHWKNCSKSAWEAVQKWTNSGEKLREYKGEYIGKPVPEKEMSQKDNQEENKEPDLPKEKDTNPHVPPPVNDVIANSTNKNMNPLIEQEPKPKNKSKYRLYPIIIGERSSGYELQERYKFLGIPLFWIPVTGAYGDPVRDFKSNKQELIDLAWHLDNPKYL